MTYKFKDEQAIAIDRLASAIDRMNDVSPSDRPRDSNALNPFDGIYRGMFAIARALNRIADEIEAKK